jgi:hypothetical protein
VRIQNTSFVHIYQEHLKNKATKTRQTASGNKIPSTLEYLKQSLLNLVLLPEKHIKLLRIKDKVFRLKTRLKERKSEENTRMINI